jgi:hypothetical protein
MSVYSGYGGGYLGTTDTPTSNTIVASRSTSWAMGSRPAAYRSTSWSIFSVTTVTVRPTSRLRVYAPAGNDLGPLPTPQSVSMAYPLNDVSGLTFDYSVRAPRAELLGQPCEIAVEVSPDSGKTWVEPPDSRFVYLSDNRDPLSNDDRYSVEAKGYAWRLSKSKVWPTVAPGTINSSGTVSLLNADGKRAFLGVTVGKLLQSLFSEARSRKNAEGDPGMLGIDSSSFDLTSDSAGQAWNTTLTIYYEPGIDYLAVLMDLADQGYCDFRMQGRSLYVYNAETRMAQDRTIGTGQVTLRAGRDLTEAPMRRTWEGLADSAYFAGADGTRYQYTNPLAITPWGRQETYISNGSVSDEGTMAALTQAELSKSDRERTEYTRGLDFTRAVSRPFWDYGVGDYVWSDVDGTGVTRLRVRQLTLTVSDKGILAGNVVLNDRFLEADVRQARRIQGITNGASSGPGTGGGASPDDPGGSVGTPAKVGSVTGSSVAYMGPGGFPQAQVSLSWQEVTRNTDGLLTNDIDHYEIFRREMGLAAALGKQIATTTDTDWSGSPYQVGSNWVFQVRAANSAGKRGEKSNDLAIGMAQDTVPPQAPSTPIITARLGTVSVQYDGKPSYGTWPLDFSYVEVHTSPANNFTPTTATRIDTLYGAGVTVITNGDYGVPIFVRFVAVDTTGLRSDPSAQAFGTPSRLVGSDLDADAITFEQIQYKDSGNLVFDGSFEDDDYRANLSARSSSAWTFTTADYYHGSWSATINAAANPSTSRQLVMMQASDAQQIMAADKVFCRMAYKGSAGSTGVLQLVILWTLRDGSTSTSTLIGVTKNGTWQQIAGQLTAPANAREFRAVVELTSTGTSGTYSVDAVEVRRTIGTSIIQDAAIGNAQINNLAVNNAKVADLSAGKLTAGTLSADVLIAGRIMTATSGNRVEMSSTGIRLYRGATVTAHLNPVNGQLRVYNTGDATHTSTNHGIQFGDEDGYNLIIDNNEIMSRFNGDYSTLYLNREGGRVSIGGVKQQLRPDPETWLWPASNDQVIDMNGSVQINNARTSFQNDYYPPLNVGPRTGDHMWFDWQSIGSSGGAGGPNAIHISPPHPSYDHLAPVWIGSDSIAIRRIGTEQGGVFSTEAGVCLQFYQGQVNSRSADSGVTGNRSMGASSFVVLSQESTKERIGDIPNALDVVRRVKSKRWQFRDHINPEDQWHYGPVLEELPKELHMPIGNDQQGYDVVSLVGLLWQAFRDHLDECRAEH